MKYLFLICMGIATCSAVAQPANHETQTALVEKLVDAISNKDSETMASLLHDGYTAYGPGYDEEYNKQSYLNYWKLNWQNFSNIEYRRQAILTQHTEVGDRAGDWVFDWVDFRVSFYAKPDAPIIFRTHSAYLIKDGKIYVAFTYYDMADIYRKLGYTFQPPGQY